MTGLSDFPPDVQAAAKVAIRSHGFPSGDRPTGVMEQDIEAIVASAIVADRSRRIDLNGLTERQAECLRFIASHQEQHNGVTPSYREVADFLGLSSTSGVTRLLDGLEERGRIKRLPNRSRAITIIANPAN